LSYASYRSDLSGEFRHAERPPSTTVSTTCPPKAHNGVVIESFSRQCCRTAPHRSIPLSSCGQNNRHETIARRRNVLQISAGIEWTGTQAFTSQGPNTSGVLDGDRQRGRRFLLIWRRAQCCIDRRHSGSCDQKSTWRLFLEHPRH